jgi:hypothetical protein
LKDVAAIIKESEGELDIAWEVTLATSRERNLKNNPQPKML